MKSIEENWKFLFILNDLVNSEKQTITLIFLGECNMLLYEMENLIWQNEEANQKTQSPQRLKLAGTYRFQSDLTLCILLLRWNSIFSSSFQTRPKFPGVRKILDWFYARLILNLAFRNVTCIIGQVLTLHVQMHPNRLK